MVAVTMATTSPKVCILTLCVYTLVPQDQSTDTSVLEHTCRWSGRRILVQGIQYLRPRGQLDTVLCFYSQLYKIKSIVVHKKYEFVLYAIYFFRSSSSMDALLIALVNFSSRRVFCLSRLT